MEHQAFDVKLIIDKLAQKVECIDVFRDRLLLGTAEGIILVCSSESPDKIQQKVVSKKAIQQLYTVESCNILLVLTDLGLCAYDFPSFALRSNISRTKGCSLFSVNEDAANRTVLLSVAFKKKILLFEWDIHRMDFIERGELTGLSSVPKAMSWCGDTLFLGSRSQYDMFNHKDGSPLTKIFPTGRNATSLILPLPKKQLLLAKDNVSILVGPDGKPRWRHGLTWPEDPIALAYSYPYIVALLSKTIEIRSLYTDEHEFVQSLSVPKPVKTIIAAVPKTRLERSAELPVAVYIIASSHIWRMQPIDMMKQTDEMVEKMMYLKSLTLCNMIPSLLYSDEEKAQKAVSINTQHAFQLFFDGNFFDAMTKFEKCEADPAFVLGLYPKMISDTVRSGFRYPDVAFPELTGDRGIRAFKALVEYLLRRRAEFEEEEEEEERYRLLEAHDNAIASQSPARSGAFSVNTPPRVSTPSTPSPANSLPVPYTPDILDGRSQPRSHPQASSSVWPASSSSQQSRTPQKHVVRSPPKFSIHSKVLIDTSLIKAFLVTHPDKISSFLNEKHTYADINACEKILLNHGRIADLVLLYQTRGTHRAALQLLLKHGQGAADNPLHGPEHTVKYLRSLTISSWDLVKEFSKWVLKSYPQEGLSIFTYEHPAPPDRFDRANVFNHLKGAAGSLCLPYLEWAIGEAGETRSEFHNEYIHVLLELITQQRAQPHYSPSLSSPHRQSELSRRLLAFLESSRHYSPEKILVAFPKDQLLDARAVLLSRLQQYDSALEIYARKLNDLVRAEAMCENVWANDEGEEGRDVWLAFLRVLLGMGTGTTGEEMRNGVTDDHDDEALLLDGLRAVMTGDDILPSSDVPSAVDSPEKETKKPMLKEAMALLETKFDVIDKVKAISLLPDDLPLSIVYQYFRNVFRESEKQRRDNQVVKEILRSEQLQTSVQLIDVTNTRLVIDESTVCTVCSKRIANTIFALYPSGKLVHFFCMKGENDVKE